MGEVETVRRRKETRRDSVFFSHGALYVAKLRPPLGGDSLWPVRQEWSKLLACASSLP